jgi:hypothetical protein
MKMKEDLEAEVRQRNILEQQRINKIAADELQEKQRLSRTHNEQNVLIYGRSTKK